MVDCRYCDEQFADEDALLEHLSEDHNTAELSRIDRRRLDDTTTSSESDGLPSGAIAGIGVTAVILVAMLVAVVLLGNGGALGDDPQPYTDEVAVTPINYGEVHEHGLMEVTIEDETFDFADDQSLLGADEYFHFHGGDHVWHTHGEQVTLEYALATLGIEVEEAGTVLKYDGGVYDDREDGTTVSITVNGETVNPSEYVLDGVAGTTVDEAAAGDYVVVTVETSS